MHADHAYLRHFLEVFVGASGLRMIMVECDSADQVRHWEMPTELAPFPSRPGVLLTRYPGLQYCMPALV